MQDSRNVTLDMQLAGFEILMAGGAVKHERLLRAVASNQKNLERLRW